MNSYLYLKIKDYQKEKLILKLSQINIRIYDIYQKDDYIFFKVNIKDYEKINKYLNYLEIKKDRFLGINKIIYNLKKYKYSFLGILVSIIIIFIFSFIIVDIKIIHEDKDLVTIINYELENYGIKKFSFAKSYDELAKIKKAIKERHLDKIDWLEINKEGMHYIVRVEERIITNIKPKDNYCHIIAKKDGVIQSINIIKGEQKVLLNDYVKKGDIIISGDINLDSSSVNKTCASGKIYAEVWYEVNVNVPLVYYEKIKTGKKRNNIIINYKDIDYIIFKNRIENYESQKKIIFDALGIKISLRKDEEIIKKKKVYSEKEAIKLGISKAEEKINIMLEKKEYIKEEKVLQKQTNNSTINLDIFIVAVENIAEKVVLKEEDSDGI